MSEILRLLRFAEAHSGEPLALATVVRTRGSTYRRPGARMLIANNGGSVGAVSGGCLERDVAGHAREVLADGRPRLLAYDTRPTLGCNGVVEIFVERLSDTGDVLGYLRRQMERRNAGVLATAFSGGGEGRALGTYPLNAEHIPAEWKTQADEVLRTGSSALGICEQGSLTEIFFHVVQPPIRLVVVGAGYDVLPLAHLAKGLSWEVVIVGPSSGGEVHDGLENEDLIIADPRELAANLRPDPFTAVVLMTHHFGRDVAFLNAMLPLGLPYLGVLGPRKRRAQLLAALADNGYPPDPEALDGLRSPIGLDLGGDTPEEIALSILAEVRAVLAGRGAAPLRDIRRGIHEGTSSLDPQVRCIQGVL